MTDKKHANGRDHSADAANGQTNGQAAEPAAETEAAPQETAAEAGGDAGLRAELDAARDRHLRLAAEFDNYRKRMQREMEESRPRAQAELAGKLLDALDDLQRIADFDPETTSSKALHEGAEMVERKMLRVLEAAGLERVEADGKPFDPMVHEAITTVPTDASDEDDTVADVFQQGYRFKGILLRPARVRVKKHGG
ncbi:MAG TPA: nucleotide exchange factor GrpE [Longimicrobiaceae bacterium]|nr:nucleotide exchange factor GrpE [Longimicrobiaceae bacterium]